MTCAVFRATLSRVRRFLLLAAFLCAVALPARAQVSIQFRDSTNTVLATYLNGTVVFKCGSNMTCTPSGQTVLMQPSSGGGSSLTSVVLVLPTQFGQSSSTVGGVQTTTITWNNFNAHYIFAGPPSGSPAAPTARAMVLADLPACANGQVLQTAGGVQTCQTIAGTGTVTNTAGALTAGQLIIGNGGNDITVGDLTGDATTSGATAVTVVKVNGVSFGTGPSTNTVPVVTGTNATTYEAVPNAALANSSFTVTTAAPLGGAATISLGGTLALTCTNCVTGSSLTSGELAFGNGTTTVTVGNLSGDATTSGSSAVTVVALQGNAVKSASPSDGNILTWVGADSKWEPVAPAPSSAFEVDGTPLTSSTTVNFQDSAGFNGLTATFSNPSAGNVKLGFSGTLGNGGLAHSSATVNGQTCTLGSTCTVSGAENTQTSTYTLLASDLGKLVVMNCSSACSVKLYGAPTNGYYGAIESIGSTTATVDLNSLNFNGSSSIPSLNSGRLFFFWSDGSNYFGTAPLVAGTGLTFTPASNGLTVALTTPVSVANGGSGAGTFTAHGVLLGETTSAFGVTGAGTAGQVLTSNGASSDPTFQAAPTSFSFPFGGDGSDGAIDLDGTNTYPNVVSHTGSVGSYTYSLIRDAFATTLTVESGIILKTAEFRIFASTSVTANGTIRANGVVGGAGGNSTGSDAGGAGTGGGNAEGALGSQTSLRTPYNANAAPNGAAGKTAGTGAGTNGANNSFGLGCGSNVLAVVSGTSSNGATGGNGGTAGANAGGTGASGGGVASATAAWMPPREPIAAITLAQLAGPASVGASFCSAPGPGTGGSGGSGAGDGVNAGGGSGGSGGNGGAGGNMVIATPTITVGAAGTISANGATGGQGGNGGNSAGGTAGGGGGGAGGSGGEGGIVVLVYHTLTNGGTISASGGSGGSGGGGGTGSSSNNGTGGGTGTSGGSGVVIQITF